MANFPARVLLFVSSYVPLILIIALLFLKNSYIAVASVVLAVACWIVLRLYIKQVKTIQPHRMKAVKGQRKDGEVIGYIVSYLLPFLLTPNSDWNQIVAVSAFFILLAVLFANSNLVYVNPMLNAAGYRTFEVELEDGSVFILISKRRRVKPNDVVWVIDAGDEVYIEKEEVQASSESSNARSRRPLPITDQHESGSNVSGQPGISIVS